MDIITLFCEIDDFSLHMNNIKHNTSCRIYSKQPTHEADPDAFIRESVYKELKSQTEIQHTRHKGCANFQANTIAALIAYTSLKKKPSLTHRELQEEDFQLSKICDI